jgi:hypothetical protein
MKQRHLQSACRHCQTGDREYYIELHAFAQLLYRLLHQRIFIEAPFTTP